VAARAEVGAGERPRCAVVIPTYDGAHVLRACLEALLAQPPERCDMEVVVVDDASTDGTPQRLDAFADRITLVVHEENQGFGRACNTGARAAGDADHLVFLNNDTIPLAGWLDALVDELREHPSAAAVGARLLFPNGTVQHAGVAIGQDHWPRHLYTGFPGEHPAVVRSRKVAAVTAACMLVRRDRFEALGGFDEAYVNGYEDIDFCLRLVDGGHDVRYCGASVLYHLESVTRWPTGERESTAHNDQLYIERWIDRVVPDDVQHFLDDGLITVDYGDHPPLRIEASPLVATIEHEGEFAGTLERVLSERSAEVMELQGFRTRTVLAHRRALEAARPTASRDGGARSATLLRTGAPHRLDGVGAQPRHRVSVLLPVKDGAADLRAQLPLVLAQRADAELEIVAVDSGSTDDSLDVLGEYDATIWTIDPADFDHGLTRNLLAEKATGDVLVLLTHNTRPVDEDWLAPLLWAVED
jgi:GT2 family glycosyltransferase